MADISDADIERIAAKIHGDSGAYQRDRNRVFNWLIGIASTVAGMIILMVLRHEYTLGIITYEVKEVIDQNQSIMAHFNIPHLTLESTK